MTATPFAWKGFDTFILDASLQPANKEQVIKIFANKLYDCINVNNYYFRLLNAYIAYLNNKNAGNTFNSVWNKFVSDMTTTSANIKEIAIKLLVLVQRNTDYTKTPYTITISDIYDTTKRDHINTINTTDSFRPIAPSTSPATAKEVADTLENVDALIKTVEGVATLFDWKDFTDIFTGVTEADPRKYICKYFITELSAAKSPNANQYTDEFILLMYLIKANVSIDKAKVNALREAVKNDKAYTVINNIAKALHILFEINDLETNIGTATADDLKIFVNELATVAPTKAITFDKTKLPASWKNYELLNVLSYDVSIIKDTAAPANDVTKYGNILTFLNTISTPPAAPNPRFNPNIIALQNTSGLQASTTYKTTETAITDKGYNVGTSAEAITFIHTTDTNTNRDGNLTATDSHVFYQYSFNDAKKYLIVNIISKCDDKGDKKAISTPAIIDDIYPEIHKQIKYEPNQLKCLLIISGKIDATALDSDLVTKKKFENSTDYFAKYNKKQINDIHIYTANLRHSQQTFDILPINKYLTAKTNYSTSEPLGIRLFLSSDVKPLSTSKPKYAGPINMKNLHTVLADELDTLDGKQITALLESISAPYDISKPDKKVTATAATTGKAAATPATTPPVGKKINMFNIKEIDFIDAQSKGMIKLNKFQNTIDSKYKKLKINSKTGKFDKKVYVIFNEGTDPNAEVYKVYNEEKYCIMVNVGAAAYAVHDILIKGDKVFYSDTSSSKGHLDIDITAHVKT